MRKIFPHISEDYMRSSLGPLMLGVARHDKRKASWMRSWMRVDPEMLFYFAYDCGYLVWTRSNPGQIPNAKQIDEWFRAMKKHVQYMEAHASWSRPESLRPSKAKIAK